MSDKNVGDFLAPLQRRNGASLPKIFALVDCNSFFCSCERLFRPELKDQPVVVLSNNDGCVISRTNQAKKLDIPMGEPYFKIKNIVRKHKVHVFSSNFALYTNLSHRVMTVLSQFTHKMEVYSVDEAFLELDGFEHLDLDDYAKEIKRTVFQLTGIPVSVGIGPTKVLSKVANHIAKKSQKAEGTVVLLGQHRIDAALERIKIEDIWGIGRQSAKKLNALGIRTGADLRDYKNERKIQKLLTKVGLRLKQELAGESLLPLECFPEKKKEIMTSRTFSTPVLSLEDLKESVANYVSSSAESLRGQSSVCSSIEVFARTNPFNDSAQFYCYEEYKSQSATCDTIKLIKYAHGLLEEMFKNGYEYKKAGIKLTRILDCGQGQISLFEENDTEKDLKLMETMDRINQRNGPGSLKSGACGVFGKEDAKAWRMNRQFLSPRYVSGWLELPKAS